MKRALSLIGACLLLGACETKPPAVPVAARTSHDMIEECQRVLRQGYTVGTLDNPRATFKVFGELTTVEITATYKADADPRGNPVGFRCLFEKGKLFQAGSAVF